MREYKPRRKSIICLTAAAAVCAALTTGCYNNGSSAYWDDTLPSAETESSRPTAVYLTEETEESSEPIIIPTSESTKRTAYSEPGPELATTVSTERSADSESEASTVSGVPNVPISEFTSTTPVNLATQTSASSSFSASAGTSASAPATTSSAGSESVLISSSTAASETTGFLDTETSTVGTPSASDLNRPYSYRFLDEKHKFIYDQIISTAEKYGSTINFSADKSVTSEEYCDIYQIIYDDEPSLFYIDKKMQYAVNSSTKQLANAKLFYKYGNSAVEKMQGEIDAEVNSILGMITADMSDYDKVKLFHDVLASTVVYDENAANCRDIYGVFVDKKAICGGFSKAFSYLCSKVGIETVTVTGDADGIPHMWNKVKIGGKWYNIDITYAVSNSADAAYVRYDYFCVTDKMLTASRTVYEQSYKYPEANSDDCNYFVMNGLVAESWAEARILLRDGLIECAKNKISPVQVKCANKDIYDEAVFNLFDSSSKQALDIYEEAYEAAKNKYNASVVNFSYDATSMVIKLFPEYD
ncbi:MAG: hypothetical protein K2J72_10825 [Oscillospiraceae bacterium]|nr:hypothetical protein [Oscillospiraceae bacterium]